MNKILSQASITTANRQPVTFPHRNYVIKVTCMQQLAQEHIKHLHMLSRLKGPCRVVSQRHISIVNGQTSDSFFYTFFAI